MTKDPSPVSVFEDRSKHVWPMLLSSCGFLGMNFRYITLSNSKLGTCTIFGAGSRFSRVTDGLKGTSWMISARNRWLESMFGLRIRLFIT